MSPTGGTSRPAGGGLPAAVATPRWWGLNRRPYRRPGHCGLRIDVARDRTAGTWGRCVDADQCESLQEPGRVGSGQVHLTANCWLCLLEVGAGEAAAD